MRNRLDLLINLYTSPIKCAVYNGLREKLHTKIQNYCKNFIKLDNEFKFVWLMTTENIFLAENLSNFLIQSFELRSLNISDG
jgi:hypothetical protein